MHSGTDCTVSYHMKQVHTRTGKEQYQLRQILHICLSERKEILTHSVFENDQ